MTLWQRLELLDIARELKMSEFHHGDCVGADADAAQILRANLLPLVVVCHPPVDQTYRAFTTVHDRLESPRTHLARNREIVRQTEVLIGCPYQAERQTRGGTWYTIDYARKRGRRVIVIAPDGTVDDD